MAEQPQPVPKEEKPKERGFGRGGDNKKGGKRPERKKE